MRTAAFAALACAVLAGCTVQLHGSQAGAGQVTSASTSLAANAGANAQVVFQSGSRIPAGAPGAQVSGGFGLAAAAVAVAVVAELLESFAGSDRPVRALPRDARIAHTCSCYGYKPPATPPGGEPADRESGK